MNRKISFFVLCVSLSCQPETVSAKSRESNVDHLKKIDPDKVDWSAKSDAYWKKNLTGLQYKVCRKDGTEYAWSGLYNGNKKNGVYHCSSCGLALFSSKTKFNSGTGWPSYYEPIKRSVVTLRKDYKFGITRVEVRCARCDAHLGHVFSDGPKPTGLRYCINSVCLYQKLK